MEASRALSVDTKEHEGRRAWRSEPIDYWYGLMKLSTTRVERAAVKVECKSAPGPGSFEGL